jgi:hypothetical protein
VVVVVVVLGGVTSLDRAMQAGLANLTQLNLKSKHTHPEKKSGRRASVEREQ